MNKKVIAFLSLFSLVLILSIYDVISPFGENSTLAVDFYHQYGPMLAELYERIKSGGNLIYSFTMSSGLPFFRNFLNYLASPFNIIIFLFKRENLLLSYSILMNSILWNSGSETLRFLLELNSRKSDSPITIFVDVL